MEKAINRLLLLTAVLTLVFCAAAYAHRNDEHDAVRTVDKVMDVCEYIDIDVLRLDVELIPYDGDKIRIAYKNELPLDIKRGDNRLSISESDDFVISLFLSEESEFGLTLWLPKTVYREITVYTGAGSVKAGGVNSEKLTIVTNSGDITCEDTISLVTLASGSGNISLDFRVVIEGSAIQSRSGSAKLSFPAGNSVAVDFETDTGECVTDLMSGQLSGSNMYSFNGGGTLVHATIEKGTLKISEKKEGA